MWKLVRNLTSSSMAGERRCASRGDDEGLLPVAGVGVPESPGDLSSGIGGLIGGVQAQPESEFRVKVPAGEPGLGDVEDRVRRGVEGGREGPEGGGLARAHLSGHQPETAAFHQIPQAGPPGRSGRPR